jgi:hypothetical protein
MSLWNFYRHTNSSKALIHFGILSTFALTPVWYRFSFAPPPFTQNYVSGFLIFVPIIWTIALWFLTGFPGLKSLVSDRLRLFWIFTLLTLVLWAYASIDWAFMHNQRPDVAKGFAFQLAVVALFVIVVACSGPSARMVVFTLSVSLFMNGIVGGLQVANQGSIGLQIFGEFELNPEQSGVSVIQSGETRWLRPYGFASHPNVFAGFLVVGLLSTTAWILHERKLIRRIGTLSFLFGLWILFLTFSRGAWLGFLAGAIILAPLLARKYLKLYTLRRHILRTASFAVILGFMFLVIYRPFLLARAGVGNEHTEQRSINERVVYIQIADIAIQNNFLKGVGAGNFPWFASYYLFYNTNLDLRGEHVHNVYLSIQAELGIVGAILFALLLILGVEIAIQPYSEEANSVYRYVLLSSAVAFAIIGVVDHYVWTMIHFQTLWLSLFVLSGRTSSHAL